MGGGAEDSDSVDTDSHDSDTDSASRAVYCGLCDHRSTIKKFKKCRRCNDCFICDACFEDGKDCKRCMDADSGVRISLSNFSRGFLNPSV